jgi:DNA-binding transcriptional LysR family regulator
MYACFRGGLKTPHIVQEALDQATMLSLVTCRLGVAFVSDSISWRCPVSVVLLSVMDLHLSLPFSLVWRKENISPLLAKFVVGVRQLSEAEAFVQRGELRSRGPT